MIHTPSNLEVLLHCHCSPTVHPHIAAQAVQEAHAYLIAEGMIKRDDRHHTTTEKGKFYIAYLMKVPFPETQYVIPQVP